MNSEVPWKICALCFVLLGVFSVSDGVVVMEGDSVTLNSNVKKNIQEKIKWYFNNDRIAEITGDQSKICTDVQCKERFRDRLKLDHQTGSLTITNIISTDTGVYILHIINSGDIIEESFSVSVHGVSAAERDEMKRKTVKKGESVTLYPGVINPNDLMTWYFNDILIAEISGDQSKICTDDQCKERFRDRLKLDHQTGSLTITNARNTDFGEYKLQINSSRFSIRRKLPVLTVIDSNLSSGPAVGISAAVLLVVVLTLVAAAAMIYYHKCQGRTTKSSTPHNVPQENGEKSSFINHTDKLSVTAGNGMSHNGDENVTASET